MTLYDSALRSMKKLLDRRGEGAGYRCFNTALRLHRETMSTLDREAEAAHANTHRLREGAGRSAVNSD